MNGDNGDDASLEASPSHSYEELVAEREALRRELERVRVYAADDRSRGILKALLEHSPHGIIVSDEKGILTLHNRAAERIWAGSATAHSVPDWGVYRAFHPDGRPYDGTDWAMARCLASGAVTEAEEVHFQRFDGTHGILLGSCAPIRNPDGSIQGALSVFADISRLKEAEHLRDRWVAVASHEMRTPLSVMVTQLDRARLLLQRGGAVDVGELVDVLRRQVSRQSRLVEDLVDVSRAQAGTLRVESGVLEVCGAVRRAAEPLLTAGHHRFEFVGEEIQVLGDAARVEQVVGNLVVNATRYSPHGRVIRVTVEARDGEAIVRVADEGLGFEPRLATLLFEPFFQLAPQGDRSSGLGLGLFLARELVTRMGGRIWAHSDGPGSGSTFAFSLPLAPAASAE